MHFCSDVDSPSMCILVESLGWSYCDPTHTDNHCQTPGQSEGHQGETEGEGERERTDSDNECTCMHAW